MKTIVKLSIFSAIFFLFLTCSNESNKKENLAEKTELVEDKASEELLAINASQFGVKYTETFILMQNRKGIRIEYNVDRSRMQLWLSPQAGKSFSYMDKNWSNRDDHTNIFDRILIPGLNLATFDSCQWDPFHSKVYFKDQVLNIAQVYTEPAVLIWFEKEGGLVDLKIMGEEVKRDENEFTINFSDRGRNFQSTAQLSNGTGYFQHQMQLDTGRSIHARAHMAPGQYLLLASELEKENIAKVARTIIKTKKENILTSNEKLIKADLQNGQFTLKNRPDMQKLLDIGRRTALSMQDFDGFMRSTNQYIYYLLWFRDGGMNTGHIAYTGWTEPVYDHAKYSLLNPNVSHEEPSGEFFGQLMSGPITKWQEDGLFYAIWPAFNYWTQTGDKSLCEGEYLQTLEDAMAWLEEYCFDEEAGLFGRYYACETPMTGSRGDGFDQANGAPTFRWGSEYEGTTIVRSYDNYVNLLHYSTYLMLSAMETGEKAQEYYQKAIALEENMKRFFDYEGDLPSYGELEKQEGGMVTAAPYGMDIWDYVWGLSLPPFKPNLPEKYKNLHNQIYRDMTTTEEGYFLCVYFALLTSMDTEIHNEDSIIAAMDKMVPLSVKPGKYLPMPYAVPEMFNIEDGDPFHDVRPLVYSIAPWLSAVTNLGVRKMPFGIALRGSNYLENIQSYIYKKGTLDISFSGKGELNKIILNEKPLLHTLQIPENLIKEGNNKVSVELLEKAENQSNILVSSTVQLDEVIADNSGLIFKIEAYGKNVLTFKNLDKHVILTDENGENISYTTQKMDDLTYVEFKGRGNFEVSM